MFKENNLPMLPSKSMSILSLLRKPEISSKEIAKEIQYDPALVVSLFKLVNSAAFGLRHRVEDLKQATALLGKARIEAIVLSHSVKNSLSDILSSWFNFESYWSTAIARAVTARKLAEELSLPCSEQCFTAGLLQDIGVLFILKAQDKKYKTVVDEFSANPEDSIINPERKHLSVDHQIVGAVMAKQWNLPDYLTTSINGHHTSESVQIPLSIVSVIDSYFEDLGADRAIDLCKKKTALSEKDCDRLIKQSLEDARSITF